MVIINRKNEKLPYDHQMFCALLKLEGDVDTDDLELLGGTPAIFKLNNTFNREVPGEDGEMVFEQGVGCMFTRIDPETGEALRYPDKPGSSKRGKRYPRISGRVGDIALCSSTFSGIKMKLASYYQDEDDGDFSLPGEANDPSETINNMEKERTRMRQAMRQMQDQVANHFPEDGADIEWEGEELNRTASNNEQPVNEPVVEEISTEKEKQPKPKLQNSTKIKPVPVLHVSGAPSQIFLAKAESQAQSLFNAGLSPNREELTHMFNLYCKAFVEGDTHDCVAMEIVKTILLLRQTPVQQ
jgi:hypothetical protein